MRSTKILNTEKNRKKATAVAREMEDIAAGDRSLGAVKKLLIGVYQQETAEESPLIGAKGFLASWGDDASSHVAKSTAAKYKAVANSFIEHLGPKAEQPLILVTRKDVSKWHVSIAKTRARKTANNLLKVLRSAFAEAEREGHIDQNPAKLVKPLKGKDTGATERRPFTVKEISEMLTVAKGEEQTLIMLGYYTGQRLGDICVLDWSNVRFDTNEVVLSTAKTGRKQAIPMAPKLREHLEALKPAAWRTGPVMPSMSERYTKASSSASGVFRRVMERAGLVEKRSHQKADSGKGRASKRHLSEISFHSFRHTLTTQLKAAGVSGQVVQEIVGHDSAAVSKGYSHLNAEPMQAAIGKLPEVG